MHHLGQIGPRARDAVPALVELLSEPATLKREHVAQAIGAKDFSTFDTAFRDAVAAGNAYHDQWQKGFIVWRLPDFPPPDLDLTPRQTG